MFKKEIYQNRRNQLKKLIHSGIIILPGNSASPCSGPAECFPFRQDSSFLYFTGIDIPDLTCVIDTESGDEWLFGNDDPPDAIFWQGQSPSLSDHCAQSGIDHHAPEATLSETVQQAQTIGRPVHFLPPYQAQVIMKLHRWLGSEQNGPTPSSELIGAVVQLRSVKDEHEIREIEAAIAIAHKMHTTAMIMAMPGARERDIKGVMEGLAISAGGALSFQPIVTIRGDILHNPRYTNTLESESLLLIDAGAESPMHYASDITRTIPVGRSFSRLQRHIYEIVLQANLAAIEAIKPGRRFLDIHLQAALIIAEGLKDLGIMKGDPQEAVNQGAHALFFPHGLGHMLGLDTHDMESLGEDAVGYGESVTRSDQFGLSYLRLAKPLETGNVVTVEPGIYFIQPLIDAWKKENRFSEFINYDQVNTYTGMGGVRIEDNVLVTDSAGKVLGKPIPKSIKELETL